MSCLVFATDLHLTEGQGGLLPFATDLQEIAALSPDLLVLGGDICLWEAGAGDRLQKLLDPSGLKTMHLMGNHDTDRDGSAAKFDSDFTSRFGSRNWYVNLGDAHAIGLNTCLLQPEHADWRNVRAEVGTNDLDWLDSTLSGLQRDLPLLLFVHIPLATTYPERRNASKAITDVWRVTNADAVFELLHAWGAPVIICQGHLHENEHLHIESLHLISVGSVCGRWWQQGEESRCTDDSPRGWLVLHVDDGDVAPVYHAARDGEISGEIVERLDGEAGDLLNLFFADPAEMVEIRVDGAWRQLTPPEPVAVDDPFVSVHHWSLPREFAGDALQVRTSLRGRPWDMGVIHRRKATLK